MPCYIIKRYQSNINIRAVSLRSKAQVTMGPSSRNTPRIFGGCRLIYRIWQKKGRGHVPTFARSSMSRLFIMTVLISISVSPNVIVSFWINWPQILSDTLLDVGTYIWASNFLKWSRLKNLTNFDKHFRFWELVSHIFSRNKAFITIVDIFILWENYESHISNMKLFKIL